MAGRKLIDKRRSTERSRSAARDHSSLTLVALIPWARAGRCYSPAVHQNEMPIEIGQIEALFRYPVKSMRGEPLDAATLGWHGLDGDRRLAFRRLEERGGFPWLIASKHPDLILFTPQ